MIGISKTHLRLIEEGRVWPDSQMLIKMSIALNTNTAHFFIEPREEIEKILEVSQGTRTIEDMVLEALGKGLIGYGKASDILGYKLRLFDILNLKNSP